LEHDRSRGFGAPYESLPGRDFDHVASMGTSKISFRPIDGPDVEGFDPVGHVELDRSRGGYDGQLASMVARDSFVGVVDRGWDVEYFAASNEIASNIGNESRNGLT
jgi:hypothetical protein